MWANNEVGTLQPIDEVVAIAAPHGIPVHTDAIQAVGAVPVDFSAIGVDLMTITGHKIGGPFGVGALLVRRELEVTAMLHGGGQERDIRSGTLDAPAIAGFAAAVEAAVKAQPEHAGAAGRAAGPVGPRGPARGSGRHRQRTPDRAAAGQRPPAVPRLRGRLAADAARRPRHRVLHGVGVLGRGRPALPRADGDGSPRGGRAQLAALLPRPHQHRRRRRRAASPRSARASTGPARLVTRWCADVRVIAAMSGGVDSAVAAARAVEAGHDVTGIHLALSRNPASYRSGARGCCTLEDAHDARRAADVIGIPFYVWDLSERFHEDVVVDFMDEYAAGRTPNPCLRCNEKIKFAAVLDRAIGARLRRRGDRALRAAAL